MNPETFTTAERPWKGIKARKTRRKDSPFSLAFRLLGNVLDFAIGIDKQIERLPKRLPLEGAAAPGK